MTSIRVFTDEDVHRGLSPALRSAGLDAMSTPEAGRESESDESQLSWAAAEGRVILTFNVGHFVQLHSQWLAAGGHHAGIIVPLNVPSAMSCDACNA